MKTLNQEMSRRTTDRPQTMVSGPPSSNRSTVTLFLVRPVTSTIQNESAVYSKGRGGPLHPDIRPHVPRQ